MYVCMYLFGTYMIYYSAKGAESSSQTISDHHSCLAVDAICNPRKEDLYQKNKIKNKIKQFLDN